MQRTPFLAIRYFISRTIRPERREQLAALLDSAGATTVSLNDPTLTHFITMSLPLDDSLEVIQTESQAVLVTPTWVERSRILGSPQIAEYYSPDPALLFSGVTATANDLSAQDCELLSAAISALGGQWRMALTKDVTHVFTLTTGSVKYATAMAHREMTGMVVVVPHWFEDSVRLGVRGLPTKEYEWPEPAVFRGHADLDKEGTAYERNRKIPAEKKAYFETALVEGHDLPPTRAPPHNVWEGRRVLLSTSLGLSEGQRKAHEADIQREGGIVVELETLQSGSAKEIAYEEAEKVVECDILVTRYRTGKAFVEAFKAKKTIGSLTWLCGGRLLQKIITVTNYSGKHRDYLKKLILTMGAEFTPSIKQLVLCTDLTRTKPTSSLSGTKTQKATSWSIPVVNHKWLEDCFAQWRNLTPAQEKYIKFPPRVDFSELLADRRSGGRTGYEPDELAAMAMDDGLEEETQDEASPDSRIAGAELVGTANSARDAREVEDAVALEDEVGEISIGGLQDVDIRMEDEEEADPEGESMDVDEKPQAKPKPLKKLPSAKKASLQIQRDEDEDTFRPRASSSRSPVKRYSAAKSKSNSRRVPTTLSAESEDDERSMRPPARTSSPKKKSKPAQVRSDSESDDIGRHAKTGPAFHKSKLLSDDEDEEMEVDDESKRPPRGNSKPGPLVKGKAKAKVPSEDDTADDQEDEDEESLPPRRPTRRAAKHSRSEIPASLEPSSSRPLESPLSSPNPVKRQVSVVLPTVTAVYSPKKTGSSPTKPLVKTESVRAQAAEASSRSPGKRGQLSAPSSKRDEVDTRPASPPPPAKPSRRSDISASTEPSRSEISVAPPARTPSRRSAANKATQKLRDVIMPDVMNFQKELKRGNVRPAWEDTQSKGKDAHREDDAAETKSAKSRGKKRSSAAHEDTPASEDELPEKKRQRTTSTSKKNKAVIGNGRQSRQDQEESGEEEDSVVVDSKSRRRKSSTRDNAIASAASKSVEVQSSRHNPKAVRIMTTQVTVSDEVSRILTKLGVKMTSKPSECTHLVARNLVRTEKFLCAMAVAPFVVNEKWLLASAAAKQILRA
ncbi:hypothetical protein IEO21_05394 [Rhodonia placenta]|uniref:BRCT domain-containing protein n=1 Tax=Rhodonia placenta TaxID=104341 RepID=A0A8H7P2C8_9APHY|nr:hypothetical protein IEO21_05394 [Postia placenta]